MLIDTHCHLDFPEFDADRQDVIRRSSENAVAYIINIGSSIKGSQRSVELARQYDSIYATVGIHPHEADNFNESTCAMLKELAKSPKVVAIGEVGLDYYKNYSAPENQRRMFNELVGLAKETGLPLVIHCRQANEEVLGVLQRQSPLTGVVHCFSGDEAFLRECLDLGFYVSFTCNITYKGADNLRNLVKQVALERLLLETDAPFLPPQEFRGKRNEPVYVKHLAQEIARLKNLVVEEVAEVTTSNAKNLFNLR